MSFPKKLREWREARGLTLEAAGKLINVSSATWCDWEHARKIPIIHYAEDLERVTEREVTVEMVSEFSRTETAARAERREEARRVG